MLILSFIFQKKNSDRIGDANLGGFVDLVATGTQYTAPSSKANSELDLNRSTLSTTAVKEPIFSNGSKYTYPKSMSYNRYARVQNSSNF